MSENGSLNGTAGGPADAGPSSPNKLLSPRVDNNDSPRSSMDNDERIRQLEEELEAVRGEKDVLGYQYRTLLGKLTAMRQSLGDKLREDAEELDRRETSINNLTGEIAAQQETLQTLQSELVSASQESQNLQSQLAHLRSQSDSSSSDVLSLTREMRELRGEMERLRIEREEWEAEAAKERERREAMEAELTMIERREEEGRREWEKGREELLAERQRADNLQEVLSEFSSAKDGELRQATFELESQLRQAATALSEFKLRAANAETKLGEMSNDASKSSTLSKELKEKNQIIGKLRHDAVVNNEHLTEALRRLRKNSSDNNVDRRLVTNILLQFLTTSRADSKRFEMLNILSTILSWDDVEREKAGLQRMGAAAGGGKKTPTDKGKGKSKREERSAEEEAAMNESFSNLFVEFLLKEAGQGHRPSVSSPGSQVGDPLLSPSKSPPPASLPSWSPPASGANTPSNRPRGMSGSSNTSLPMPLFGRKGSQSLQQALKGDR